MALVRGRGPGAPCEGARREAGTLAPGSSVAKGQVEREEMIAKTLFETSAPLCQPYLCTFRLPIAVPKLSSSVYNNSIYGIGQTCILIGIIYRDDLQHAENTY